MKGKRKVWHIVLLGIFLLLCVSVVISGIRITGDGPLFIIASVVVFAGAIVLLFYISSRCEKAAEFERRRRENYVFEFPKKPTSGWSGSDGILADLVYDYGMSDSEVERFIRDSVHDAVHKYRKEHPLQRPPSQDLFDTVFPCE